MSDQPPISDEELDRLLLEASPTREDLEIAKRDIAIIRLILEVRRIKKQKEGAYWERNRLVALLSALFPARLQRHPTNEEWEDDWRWVVFVDLPEGQASWHIHDSELMMFSHLTKVRPEDAILWDGHTTEEKYERVRKSIYRVSPQPAPRRAE